MGVLGPIDGDTRIRLAQARRGTRAGLVGPALDFESPPYWSIAELLFRRAEATPDRTYLVYYDDELGTRESLTYAGIADRARRIATFMREELKLGPGDVVASADLYNHPDAVAVLFASWSLGAMVVPINMREDRRRQQFILRHSNARTIFVRDRQDPGALENYLRRMTALAGDLGIPHVVQLGGDERRAAWWLDQLEPGTEPRFSEIFPAETEALLVYTAGTTGDPKGVVLTHRMLYNVRALVQQHGLSGADVFFTAMPLFHVNPIVSGLLAALYVGSTLVLNRSFNPATFLERVEDEGVTTTSVVPAMLSAICQYVRESGVKARKLHADALGKLRTVFCGSGQLYPSVAREVHETLGLRIRHGWGMSEITCWGSHVPGDLSDAEYRKLLLDARFPSIGTPNPSMRMGVIDADTGEPLPPGRVGELVAAGPAMMAGYYRNAVANDKAFRFGVLQTGDQGYYELFTREDGSTVPLFYITGRLKEVIERAGEKYSTLEIDADLLRMPVVEQALAIGFRNTVTGQEVGAVVRVKEGAQVDEKAIWRHFMTLGYSWDKTPKVIRFVAEIPTDATGKEQRLQFADQFAGLEDEVFKRPDFWTKR
jgi:long-chain acyl-CoA synthetase